MRDTRSMTPNLKTVTITVQVAVTPDGHWEAFGSSARSAAENRGTAVDGLDVDTGAPQFHVVTAEVPVLPPQTVAGEVER